MRRAALLSVALHVLILAGVWYGLTLASPIADADPDDGAVAVDILAVETVAGNAASTLESSASEQQVSAGVPSLAATPAEVAEPEQPESASEGVAEPARPTGPISAETAQNVTATEPQPIAASLLSAVGSAEAAEMPPSTEPSPLAETVEAAEPARAEIAELVPQLEAPTPAARPERLQPAAETATKKPDTPKTKKVTKARAASGGNGGASDSDSAAAAPGSKQASASDGSGSAAVAKYPGLVQRKLRKALRFPKGAGSARGEVMVRFVVAASGAVSGIQIIASSGHAILDQEAIATVRRAAPFPAIPAEAGRSNWTFTMPLAFVR